MKKVVIASLRLPDGRFVFQRRTDDAPVNPGLLGHFGGHVEQGESFEEAIRRELAEETSLELERLSLKPLNYFLADREGKSIEYHPYDIAIQDMSFKIYEGTGAEAYTAEDALKRHDLTSSVRHILEIFTKGNYVPTD